MGYLEALGYEGVVFVPEDEDSTWRHSYDDQVEWEEMCLNYADAIIFWIPRELQHMPAFTTNDEWGFWKARDPMKLVIGTPQDAPKVRYQRYYANKHDIPLRDTLKDSCAAALEKLGETGHFCAGVVSGQYHFMCGGHLSFRTGIKILLLQVIVLIMPGLSGCFAPGSLIRLFFSGFCMLKSMLLRKTAIRPMRL